MTKERIAKKQKSSKNFKKNFSVEKLKTKVIFKMDNVTIQFTQREAREVARQITKAVSAQDTHKGAEKYSTQSDTLGKKRFKTVRAYHSEDMK